MYCISVCVYAFVTFSKQYSIHGVLFTEKLSCEDSVDSCQSMAAPAAAWDYLYDVCSLCDAYCVCRRRLASD